MNSPSILFLISNDKTTRILAHKLINPFNRGDFYIIGDNSVSINKIIKLIIKRRIGFFWLIKQFISSQMQRVFLKNKPYCRIDHVVKNNRELKQFISEHPEIKMLIAFRAGLLVKEDILSKVKCVNIHYARLPEYKGLGSIDRALKNKDYKQEATVHIMDKKVDTGSTLLVERYSLDPTKKYWENELIAANAGVLAAQKYIKTLY